MKIFFNQVVKFAICHVPKLCLSPFVCLCSKKFSWITNLLWVPKNVKKPDDKISMSDGFIIILALIYDRNLSVICVREVSKLVILKLWTTPFLSVSGP